MSDDDRVKRVTDVATRMVEVWASTADALLQQWLEQGKAEDRLGMALTSVKIAQLGLMLTHYFKEVGESFLESATEVKAANQAAVQLNDMVKRAMTKAGVGEATGLAPETDPSMN